MLRMGTHRHLASGRIPAGVDHLIGVTEIAALGHSSILLSMKLLHLELEA